MFTGATDPVPYIAAAYGVAFLCLGIYGFVQVRLRQRLRQLEQAAQHQNKRRV
ncbi:MAG TPA: hypothetical protein VE954_09480 [Oligoflexus sp.]|uniref:hypothetical protein n=1 Tax=Oligoflexus sp. TaxID=1971216 RepID=UPI002D51E7FD|nr:hypothetical protein [Oligoflexus sp.]HYX33333.1 hypothetical protein [Oligoflexus sp.]